MTEHAEVSAARGSAIDRPLKMRGAIAERQRSSGRLILPPAVADE
jgi:hypothetical protein